MKKLMLTLSLLTLSCMSFAVPRFTAQAYTLEASKYLDKYVTLYIRSAIQKSTVCKEGYVGFYCSTAYKNEIGGSATVFVPEKNAKSFSKLFGAVKRNSSVSGTYSSSYNYPTKPCRVKMQKEGNSYVFIKD